jgi:cytidylate kinase
MSGSVIETLIARQIHQYNHLRALLRERPQEPPPPRRPVVAISRMAGCPTGDLAAALAERLGVQVWDSELVDRIANDRGLRRDFVARLDEGIISSVETWVRGMIGGRLFMRDDYALALASTIKTLAETGGAIFVGRGAGFILGEQADLRLRLVASERHRIEVLRKALGCDRGTARDELNRSDSARAAFVREYFHADVNDASHHDMVLNCERLEVGVMVEICECLVRTRRLRTVSARA